MVEEYISVLIVPAFVAAVISITIAYITAVLQNQTKIQEEMREIRRKRYEEFISSIESIMSRKDNLSNKELLDSLNTIHAKMYIAVPDSVIKIIKRDLTGNFDAKSRRAIYLEIRRDLLGHTSVTEDDLCYFSEKKFV